MSKFTGQIIESQAVRYLSAVAAVVALRDTWVILYGPDRIIMV